MRLAKKTALITGGNSGIGLATARIFLAKGARVAITGRNQKSLDAAASELGAITEAHFDKIFNANVKGILFTVQKALPLLKDGSSIILNASIVSVTGPPAFSVYSAFKAAVRSFARTFTTDPKTAKSASTPLVLA